MSSSVTLKIRLGPLVSLSVSGDNCEELHEALLGYQSLNKTVDEMCSDLSTRVYPEEFTQENSMDNDTEQRQGGD
jgi:hypothetical protein